MSYKTSNKLTVKLFLLRFFAEEMEQSKVIESTKVTFIELNEFPC